MTTLLRKLFNIREGEGLRAVLMFAYIFLIIASLLIVKPVRNSLFLTEFGAAQLPYAFILVALFAAIVSTVYAGFALKLRLNSLIYYTLLGSIACLFIFWLLLQLEFHAAWFIYAIYIWVAIFGVITTSQFWLLANYTFNAREAKRLFGFIGAGAISGGIFGGYLTNYLAPVVGTHDLLFICMLALALCIFIVRIIWHRGALFGYQGKLAQDQQQRIKEQAGTRSALALILESSHLKYTAALIGVSVIVANLVDYQFSAIALEAIPNEDELTAFFGFWLSNLSIASLVIQLFVTSRVLKTFGVGASLFFLPLGILLGAVTILIAPVLWAAVLIRVSDGAFKQSINKAGLELLNLPIPKAIKDQTKAFIDVFVDSFATGLGGVLLILSTTILGLTTGQISLVILALISGWIYIIIRVRKAYINSFRLAIEKRIIELDEPHINIQDAKVFENIQKVLEGKNERQILYVLGLIEDIKNDRVAPLLTNLLAHTSNEVKAKSLEILRNYPHVNVSEQAQELVGSPDKEVRIQAIQYLCEKSKDRIQTLNFYLGHEDETVQAAALMCAARESRDDQAFRKALNLKKLFDEIWYKLRRTDDSQREEFIKLNAATVVGVARDSSLNSYLHILLSDQSTNVLKAAIQSAGQTKAMEFVPVILGHLKTRHIRQAAREALAGYGDIVVDTLSDHLGNPRQDHAIRLAIPRILGMIKSQKSVNVLLNNLNQNDLLLRFEIIKALNKLKVQMPMLKYDTERIEIRILDETDSYYKLISYLGMQNGVDSELNDATNATVNAENIARARQLLIKALEERLEDNLERIFRLLGLKYYPDDMLNAYRGVMSQKNELRANAIEFLDNVLDSNLKKYIIPIVESNSPFSLIRKSLIPEMMENTAPKDGLDAILNGGDSWLRVCALYLIAEQRSEEFIGEIGKYLNDSDPMVQETARLAMRKLKLAG
jgi:AAA family ATP:ADP antiporter